MFLNKKLSADNVDYSGLVCHITKQTTNQNIQYLRKKRWQNKSHDMIR